MAQVLRTEVVTRTAAPYAVFTIPGSKAGVEYRVDMTNGRCSCPAWKFSRKNAQGERPLCKHLVSLGYSENTVKA